MNLRFKVCVETLKILGQSFLYVFPSISAYLHTSNQAVEIITPHSICLATDIEDSSVRASKDQLPEEDAFAGYATNQMLRKLESTGHINTFTHNGKYWVNVV